MKGVNAGRRFFVGTAVCKLAVQDCSVGYATIRLNSNEQECPADLAAAGLATIQLRLEASMLARKSWASGNTAKEMHGMPSFKGVRGSLGICKRRNQAIL